MRCAAATLLALVLGESSLSLLVLLVPVVLDHVLWTVHKAAERGPTVPILGDPFHEPLTFRRSDLVPVQARLEVVVPPLAALLCVSGTMFTGDFDPVDLIRVGTLADEVLESLVLVGGPRPSLLAWAGEALCCDAVACHEDGGIVIGGCNDNEGDNETGGHASHSEADVVLVVVVLVVVIVAVVVWSVVLALWALTPQDQKTAVAGNSPTLWEGDVL